MIVVKIDDMSYPSHSRNRRIGRIEIEQHVETDNSGAELQYAIFGKDGHHLCSGWVHSVQARKLIPIDLVALVLFDARKETLERKMK